MKPDPHAVTKTDVDAVLQGHCGEYTGIRADDLARQLGTSVRTVRKLVSELRMDGRAICGHPSTGYYIATTAEDLARTCEFLRARAMHSLTLESRLRNVPLPDLLGQLHLKT